MGPFTCTVVYITWHVFHLRCGSFHCKSIACFIATSRRNAWLIHYTDCVVVFRYFLVSRSQMCNSVLCCFVTAACIKEPCTPGDNRLHSAEESWPKADSSCSGQPIHLWQFLRELLLKPHNYGHCIRWLNKEKGEWAGRSHKGGVHAGVRHTF
jgi:hypothetical protein